MRPLKLLLLLSCATISVHGIAQAQSKTPTKKSDTQKRRTVRDYYLKLPSRYFAESPQENLRLRTMIVDIPNDYIETSGEAGQPYLQTALFRYQGTELFAVYAGLDSGYALEFYRLSGGKLSNVTSKVWQTKIRSNDRVYLPRRGTTIVIMDETYPGDEKTRLKLRWKNGRFVK